ncbi:pyridoxamine 5'-phosphate oxidase family protein [Carnobacterium viridans]|uniref:General stress protein 26 n=1 Tax=Carnobacterium viridans TaxID=174587 RepID=A0A1H0ZAB9_9LACT|nr:pyridoxamine 5'-phosphate oxidase family protein [Carnobacterium viridans]UDE94733.1 pyridoxamine 5'-phosphate oxidase family protein [Carnobacterium viridans]SDQ24349.1 General stress protein 26 [Carnobacterium viridans]
MADERDKALKIIEKNKIGTMSTVSENKPVSRYMTFFNEGFILYTLTDKRTDKVEDLEENPYTFILLGYDTGLLNNKYVEIAGQVSITEDQSLIEHLWSPYMNAIFDGKDDPNITVLKIQPDTVTLRGTKDSEIISVDLN